MRLKSVFALAVALTPLMAADNLPAGLLAVHEWGTFTSVADENGGSVRWLSLRPPADLPCFVYHLSAQCVKCEAVRVRMETPVIYFYAAKPLTASVHVDLPSGLVSEWYPQASRVSPQQKEITYGREGAIDWGPIEILPGAPLNFPITREPTHYYAARATDAASLQVGDQAEKLLFYRGIADFDVPLEPMFQANGKLEVRNTGADPVETAIVFENRGGKSGYRVVRALAGSVLLDAPYLSDNAASVREELTQALTSAGLYPKEAAAMVETWADSWFEEGMRIIYLVPRKTVDTVLPLKISPTPAALERVFVGRVELLSPAMQESIEAALASGDTKTLAKYGRFLRPFCDRITQGPHKVRISPAASAFLSSTDSARGQTSAAPCRVQPNVLPTALPAEQR